MIYRGNTQGVLAGLSETEPRFFYKNASDFNEKSIEISPGLGTFCSN